MGHEDERRRGRVAAILDGALRRMTGYPWREPVASGRAEERPPPGCRVCSRPTRDLDGRWHCGSCGVITDREDARPPCTRCGQPQRWDSRAARFACPLCRGFEGRPWQPIADDDAYRVTSSLFRATETGGPYL